MVTRKKQTDKRLPAKSKKKYTRKKPSHPKFGTSKAEQDFAKNFLDKLGIRYQWQFEAKGIGRFFDYYLVDYGVLLEFDGRYFHSDSRIYEEKDLNPMQKHNRKVDQQKNLWAALHGIPLIRVLEKDVIERPQWVMEMLKERLRIVDKDNKIKDNKKKRHTNKLNKLLD